MTVHPRRPVRARNELIVAWVGAALSVVSVIGILIVSEALEAALPVLVPVMFVSCAVAVGFGVSARRRGLEEGAVPASIGGVIGGFFVVMVILGQLGHMIGFE